MTIFRANHNKNYTVVNNSICKDKRLSYKAKGIWLYAFSRPDDWQFNITDLINQSTDGKDSISSGLKELVEFGYLRRERIRRPDGTFERGAIWDFYETPQDLKESLPETENPVLDNPNLEKPPLLSTEPLTNTEQQQLLQRQKKEVVVVFSKELDELPLSKSEKLNFQEKYSLEAISWMNDHFYRKKKQQPQYEPRNGWAAYLTTAYRDKYALPENEGHEDMKKQYEEEQKIKEKKKRKIWEEAKQKAWVKRENHAI
jgi:hypothetical protein